MNGDGWCPTREFTDLMKCGLTDASPYTQSFIHELSSSKEWRLTKSEKFSSRFDNRSLENWGKNISRCQQWKSELHTSTNQSFISFLDTSSAVQMRFYVILEAEISICHLIFFLSIIVLVFQAQPKPFLPHWALSVFCVIDMLFQAADKLVAISCLSCEGEVQKHNIFLTEHISLVCAICKNRQNATEALSCHGMTYQVTSTHRKILSKPLSALFKCPSLLGDKKVNCTAATYFSNSSKKAMQK